jgi:hypothetical protein
MLKMVLPILNKPIKSTGGEYGVGNGNQAVGNNSWMRSVKSKANPK